MRADFTQMRRYERALGQFADKGQQFAEAQTLNKIAERHQVRAVEAVEKQFIVRTPYTTRSIWRTRARPSDQIVEVGSVAPYLADQEFGATGGPANIPTTSASGEAPRARVRRKAVRRGNRMNAIRIKHKGKGKQANLVAVKEAAEAKERFVYQDRGRRKGIYRLSGGKRKPRIRLVQDLTRRTRIVEKKPWLAPLTADSHRHAARDYERALLKQLARRKF